MSKVTAPFASMLVVILATFFMLTSFASAASDPEPVGCNPELFSDLNEDELATCNMLYQKFEEALLVPFNIYKLRHVMFPNERAEPLVVEMLYDLTVQNLMDDPCFGADNDSLIDFDTEKFTTNITWTSSVTLSIIDPKDLDFLQPAILTFTNPITRHSYTENRNRNQVSLVLAVDTLTCTPSEQQIEGVLKDLTTKVKGYAANTEQEIKIDSWDTAYKGYVIQGGRLEFLFVIGPAISLIVIFLTCVFPVAYKKGYRDNFKQKIDDQQSPIYPLFVSVTGIVVFIDLLYYLSELACFIAIVIYQGRLQLDEYRITAVTRFVLQIVSLFLCLLTAYTILVWKQNLLNVEPSGPEQANELRYAPLEPTSSPTQQNGKDYSVCCFSNCFSETHCGNCMFIRVEEGTTDVQQHFINLNVYKKLYCTFGFLKFGRCDNFREMWILFTYASFFCMIAWSIVPILTLVFVNPVLTLAIVSFVVIFFVLSAILISLLLFVRGRKAWRQTIYYSHKNGESTQQGHSCCCAQEYWSRCLTYSLFWDFFYVLVLAILLFMFGTGVVLSIYVLIVNKGAGDSGSVGFFVAFIPTLITGGGAWFGKKALFKKTGGVTDEEMPNESDGGSGNPQNDSSGTEL